MKKVLHTLLRYKLKEDLRSVKVLKDYSIHDFQTFVDIWKKLKKLNITSKLTVYLTIDRNQYILLSNLDVAPHTKDILTNFYKEDSVFIMKIIADIHLFKKNRKTENAWAKCKELLEFLNRKYKIPIQLRLEVDKLSIASRIQKINNVTNITFYIWFTKSSFKNYLTIQKREFLSICWQNNFPVFVILEGLEEKIRTKFSILIPVHNTNDIFINEKDKRYINTQSGIREIIKKFVEEVLHKEESYLIEFLLHLTFIVDNKRTEKKIKSFLPFKLDLFSKDLNLPETQYWDFKKKWGDKHLKVAVSFANACGGIIVLGIEKDGKIVGVSKDMRDDISDTLKNVEPPLPFQFIGVPINKNKEVLFIVISKPERNVVYTLSKGERPFRYGSSVRHFRYDKDIIAYRKRLCKNK